MNTGRRARGPAKWVIACTATVCAALGVLVGLLTTRDEPERRAVPPPAPPGEIRAGELSLALPAGWSRLSRVPEIPGIPPRSAAAARGTLVDVVIASLPLQEAVLLPEAAVATLGDPPPPRRAAFGDRRAYRFANLAGLVAEAPVDIYALPTTAGVATVACVLRVTGPDATAECADAFERLDLGSARPVPAIPGVALALTLRRLVDRYDDARVALRAKLASSAGPAGRERAARRLAGLHERTAAQVSEVADTATARSLVSAFESLARAYARYAGASGARDVRAQRRAESQIVAGDRALGSRLARIEAYDLPPT